MLVFIKFLCFIIMIIICFRSYHISIITEAYLGHRLFLNFWFRLNRTFSGTTLTEILQPRATLSSHSGFNGQYDWWFHSLIACQPVKFNGSWVFHDSRKIHVWGIVKYPQTMKSKSCITFCFHDSIHIYLRNVTLQTMKKNHVLWDTASRFVFTIRYTFICET